jgi:hypothetical protein
VAVRLKLSYLLIATTIAAVWFALLAAAERRLLADDRQLTWLTKVWPILAVGAIPFAAYWIWLRRPKD